MRDTEITLTHYIKDFSDEIECGVKLEIKLMLWSASAYYQTIV